MHFFNNNTYWDLVESNSDIEKALKLFDDLNDETLLKDELVVTMLLRTMVLNDEKEHICMRCMKW